MSSSLMVATAEAGPMRPTPAGKGLLRTTMKLRSGCGSELSMIATLKNSVVTPGVNVSVPDVGM